MRQGPGLGETSGSGGLPAVLHFFLQDAEAAFTALGTPRKCHRLSGADYSYYVVVIIKLIIFSYVTNMSLYFP